MCIRDSADELYEQFLTQGVEVLLENRKERAGIMFADSELLGIPHRLVISATHADSGNIEYKSRNEVDKIEIEFKAAIDFILSKLA